MLIIVHHWNISCFRNASFNLKAFWCLNVFKVDAAKSFGDVDHGLDECFRIFGVDFNIENIDISERLQEQTFALHNWFACKSADVS